MPRNTSLPVSTRAATVCFVASDEAPCRRAAHGAISRILEIRAASVSRVQSQGNVNNGLLLPKSSTPRMVEFGIVISSAD
jgi:hypothetical protein